MKMVPDILDNFQKVRGMAPVHSTIQMAPHTPASGNSENNTDWERNAMTMAKNMAAILSQAKEKDLARLYSLMVMLTQVSGPTAR